MHKFERLNATVKHRATDAECEIIKRQFHVNDEKGTLSVGHAFYWQFWAHNALDSVKVDGEMFNRYDFNDNGEGIYPVRTGVPLLDGDKKFRMGPYGLPAIAADGLDTKYAEIAVDQHRANENPILKAHILMFEKIHNKRIDQHRDYDLAKAETIALMNQMTMNEMTAVTGLDTEEALRDIRIPSFHKMLEFNFAVARWAHAQMPSTVQGRGVFEPAPSISVDMVRLYDGSEKARKLDRGVSPAMTQMAHLPHTPTSDIRDMTFGRHTDLGLAGWGDLVKALKMSKENTLDIPDKTLIWAAMLYEAEHNPKVAGGLGPIGARAVADGLAGTLLWGEPGQGLWHKQWPNAPMTTLDIVQYAQ